MIVSADVLSLCNGFFVLAAALNFAPLYRAATTAALVYVSAMTVVPVPRPTTSLTLMLPNGSRLVAVEAQVPRQAFLSTKVLVYPECDHEFEQHQCYKY